jgi:hypothetical protein
MCRYNAISAEDGAGWLDRCPFPQVPQYKGSGATNVASSFSCVTDTWSTNPTPVPEYLD